MQALPLLLAVLLGGEPVLDDFRYVTSESAGAAWTGGDKTLPVEVLDEDRPVTRLSAPFGSRPSLDRVYVDRKARLDLVSTGGFLLEAAIDDPASIGSLTLYFRSGKGWYGSSLPIMAKGRQTFRFSKASFRKEGEPAGWDRIDGIRLAFWRKPGGEARDTSVGLRRLSAVSELSIIILPDKSGFQRDSDFQGARRNAQTLAAMLESLGVKPDEIEQGAVDLASLGDRRVVLLPNNPSLDTGCVETLSRFVASGGKVIVCYALHPKLGEILGFGKPKWVGRQREGQFAEIRFDAPDIAGLPKAVRQASWNIAAAEPVGHNARVVGRWFDDAGQPTGHPAVLLSDRGAFFSHVILTDDPEGKKRLLSALAGHFEPNFWKQIVQAELDRAGRVGHCRDWDQLADYIGKFSPAEAKQVSPAPKEQYESARRDLRQAEDLFKQSRHPEAADLARAAHESLVRAYLSAAPSRRSEGRAWWNHSGMGAFPGDWERTANLLAENGFNMILPNMLWGGEAHYPSDLLPHSETYQKHGDQIEQCCKAARKHGLEVHVWKVNYNLHAPSKEHVEKLRREARTQVTADGIQLDWLCPSHPENQKLEVESMVEVARKYPLDGIHFDYIRYPHAGCCFCAGCRERFEAFSGRKVADWPAECHSGARKREYNDWRCTQITRVVAEVSREARRVRPGIKISAAVFPAYPNCRESVAQDWPAWVEAGYLDFLCPMDYAADDEKFADLVRDQIKRIGGRVPLYPGIGARATGMGLSADRVAGQIHIARELGAAGFTIFNLDADTAASIVPGIGLGAASVPAVPPHAK